MEGEETFSQFMTRQGKFERAEGNIQYLVVQSSTIWSV